MLKWIHLLNYFLNDAGGFGPKIRTRIPRLAFLTKHSVFYYFVVSRVDNILQKAGVYKTYEELLVETYKESNQNLIFHEKILKEFISATKDSDVILVINIFPVINDFKNYRLKDAHRYVIDIAKEEDVYYLDLLPYFSQENPKDLRISEYDAHPNEKGHKIAADAIYNKIVGVLNKDAKK